MPRTYGLLAAAYFITLALSAAGCATQAPTVVTKTETVQVPVPVAVKCAADPGPDPMFPDSDDAIAAATDLTDLAKLYREGRALRIVRLSEVEAMLKGCTG